jgi:F1F0 ATPase subunit 2
MIAAVTLVTSLGGGAVLAAVFFGGLWWTVRRGVRSPRPALWFLCSMTVRTSVVLAGFFFATARPLEWLFPCLVGFMVLGLFATWRTRSGEAASASVGEIRHAPHSG